MLHRALLTLLLASIAAVVVAESEKFEGEIKVDKGKMKAVKTIALVDVSGETKFDKAKIQAWTEKSTAATIDEFTKAGFQVVSGPAVKAAFQQVAPVPTEEEVHQVLLTKRRIKDPDAARMARTFYTTFSKKEPGDSADFGYVIFRPEGSVNLDRPVFDLDKGKVDNAEPKEVQRRIAGMREKLAVDAVVLIEFGYGSTKYGEPGWVQSRKAMGKPVGLIGGIESLRGLFKGSTANVHVNIEFYDRNAKDEILRAQGHCESKDSSGLSLKGDAKVSALVDDTAGGCVVRMFERIKEKL